MIHATRRRDHLLTVEGGKPLEGRLAISGSKNAALALMAASLLTDEPVQLENLPDIDDTAVMTELLTQLRGGQAVEPELGRRMRATINVLGASLARFREVRIPRPGGDEIGARRYEQHLRALRQMGAEIEETDGELVASAKRLHGARIFFDLPTVGGTENAVMAAVLADGRTDIFNAAREPHVQDMCRLLVKMGANISGAGTDEIVVEGVERLHGATHRVIPDYLEAGTYALAIAATGGDVTLDNAPQGDLTALLLKLEQAGASIGISEGRIRVQRDPGHALGPVDMSTWTYPGFPTDLQAQYMACMTQATGTTVVSEYVHENRFQHVAELNRMGARIHVESRIHAVIDGPTRLRGIDVSIPDIRSGAALVIAALCAEGRTWLANAWHIDRGYEDMAGKLTGIGARIEVHEAGKPKPSASRTFE